MTILKLSLTGVVAIRASYRVPSAEPLVSSYGRNELMSRGIQIFVSRNHFLLYRLKLSRIDPDPERKSPMGLGQYETTTEVLIIKAVMTVVTLCDGTVV